MNFKKLTAALFTFVSLVQSSSAALVRVDFVSMVSYEQQLPLFGISPALGDPIEGHFIYNTSADDLDPADPLRGIYNIKEVSLSLGGHTITNHLTPQAVVFDLDGSDIFAVGAGEAVAGQDTILVDGVPRPGAISLSFRGLVGGDHLPDASTLVSLAAEQFNLREESGNLSDPLIIFAPNRATEINVIPEPSGVMLMIAGVMMMGVRRGRK